MDSGKAYEGAVARLQIYRNGSTTKWRMVARDSLVNEAIAYSLPTERLIQSSGSSCLVRTLLTDHLVIRIGSVFSSLGGRDLLGISRGEECVCGRSSAANRGVSDTCRCGCHAGAFCSMSMPAGRKEAPRTDFVFTLLSAPEIGPIRSSEDSWSLGLSLRKVLRRGGSDEAEVRLLLQHGVRYTRSGIEVHQAQMVVEPLKIAPVAGFYRLAA